ncbi:MAG: VCBS repeat-containing protein [Armatimonadota bacterium]|nr:VCBS repeat-containing protein [Armatimonadota bacterium]
MTNSHARTLLSLTVVMLAFCAMVRCPAGAAKGDWPMTGGGLPRSGRAEVKGKISKAPGVLWTGKIGAAPVYPISADFDGDGAAENYACENWRVVRRDADGKVRWRSVPISRSFSLIAFDDLDGDGGKEPLMLGTGLNAMAPLYFIFDPAKGTIRWKAELNPTNGGDYRFGKIDRNRKGLQLLRSIFPYGGSCELHLFCWDKGIEDGYKLWSWQWADDFIYFPQLCVGDMNNDGQNEILLMSQMCVRMFEVNHGQEMCRVTWPPRTRSYGGRFNIYPHMRPGVYPSIVISSYYNKMVLIDYDGKNMTLRWNHVFEPGEDTTLKGKEEFLPEGACDVDGDGWGEVVCNYFDGKGDQNWRAVVLGSKDKWLGFGEEPKKELVGQVMVGCADIDGDGRAEIFLRNRTGLHDTDNGPVSVMKWSADKGLTTVWTSPVDGTLVREPNDPELRLSFHPDEGDRVKLADGPNGKVFFITDSTGKASAFAGSANGIGPVEGVAMPAGPPPIQHPATAQGTAFSPTLVTDFDGDGVNEVVTAGAGEDYLVLKNSGKGSTKLIQTIKGLKLPPVFVDINGDGKVEMIAVRIAASSDDPKWQQHCVELCKTNGDLIWRRAWPADFGIKWSGNATLAVLSISAGHFTSKKTMDVVVTFTGEKSSGHCAALDSATGKVIWDIKTLYEGMYGNCSDYRPPVIFDYDGDGLDDIAMTCSTVHYTILGGKDGKQLVNPARDVSNQSLSGGEPPLFAGAWAVGCQLGAGDADGDGKPELAVFISQAAVGSFHPYGESIWFLPQAVVTQVPYPGCWADVNGDGKMELVYIFRDGFIRAYNAMTGEMLWEENMGAIGQLTAADVNGDGSDEILFSSEKGALHCLGKDAAPATESHVKWIKQFDGAPGQAVFADVNGDGKGEIVVPCSDGNLYCLGR